MADDDVRVYAHIGSNIELDNGLHLAAAAGGSQASIWLSRAREARALTRT